MTSDLECAIQTAMHAHRGQVDKGGAPYILHPLRVMLACKTELQKTVAVLHDVVEDSAIPIAMIVENFGYEVGKAVDALTRRDGESYEEFIQRCRDNDIAREVKLADLADNMDLSRLPNPMPSDLVRLQKYRAAVEVLNREPKP